MKWRVSLGLALMAALALLAFAGATPAPTAADGPAIQGPFLGVPSNPTGYNGDVRSLPDYPPRREGEKKKPGQYENPSIPPQADRRDPLLQAAPAALNMPTPGLTFVGLNFLSNGAGWPPDTTGDVGPNHYIQTVNTSIGIFNKAGTLLVSRTFDSFWVGAGTNTPCDQNNNQGDPQVLYDAIADRWIISDFGWSSTSGPFYQCIAVSKTNDPVSGGWWYYPIIADNTLLNDYPKMAVWADGYYLTSNMFNYNSGAFLGVRVYALDRTKMISGQAMTPVSFFLACGASCPQSVLAGNLRGTLPPAGTPEYVASIDAPSSNTVHVWKFHYDPVTPLNSTFTGPTNIAVASFIEPCNAANTRACIPQRSSTERVDSLGDRLMTALQYRNIGGVESLWATHTVANSASVGATTMIRWYQFNVTGGTVQAAPVQQGTYSPDSNFRWMPSLAVDANGNMAVGYSVSSSTIFPDIRYAGRLATDPLGTLGQGEATLLTGTGSQNGGFNRWGDYSAMSIDPTDDCTFWYTNEYYAATGSNWQTRIGRFKYPTCANGPTPTPTNTSTPTNTPTATNTATQTATPTNTNTPTNTATPVHSSTPTNTPTNTNTPTATRTATSTSTPTSTNTPPPTTLVENEATSMQYGDWRGQQDANASGGTYRVSKIGNSQAQFGFTDTAVTWVSLKGPDQGQAVVLIDGVNKGTFDQYSASVQYNVQQTFTGLANAAHTITVRVAGTKNANATDTNVVIDAFAANSVTTEDNTIGVRYTNWIGASSASASGGTYRITNVGANMRFTFAGTSVDWITAKGPAYGQAQVLIDGVNKGTFDLYAASQQWQTALSFTGLSNAQHVIQVKALGTKNASSTGVSVIIDAFRGPLTPVGYLDRGQPSPFENFWHAVASLLGLRGG